MRSLVTFRHSALVLAVSGLVTVALFAPAVQARAPLVDERGVLTMAPMLERPTLAVVSISVATQVPGADNPLLRDPSSVVISVSPTPILDVRPCHLAGNDRPPACKRAIVG